MKVAFSLIGAKGWTGGFNYLLNLLSALKKSDEYIEAFVFHTGPLNPKQKEALCRYVHEDNFIFFDPGFKHAAVRVLSAALLGRDLERYKAFREKDIDVVFQHGCWLGSNFGIPTMAWIADFQHKYLPAMFTRINRAKRDLGYEMLSRYATTIVVSSLDAKDDCSKLYPASNGKVLELPFSVRLPPEWLEEDCEYVKGKYGLQGDFIYMPNQFWKHKNHSGVIEALSRIQDDGVKLVCTGLMEDSRSPDYVNSIRALVDAKGLHERVKFLGLVPYDDVRALMRASRFVINPSFFEGWSTTVEEAKAMGVPIALSDLGVHKEQAPVTSVYFNPYDVDSIVDGIKRAWGEWEASDRRSMEREAFCAYLDSRNLHAQRFLSITKSTIERFGSGAK